MYALTNVTMSSNYNVANMVNDGMRILSLDELDFVSGSGSLNFYEIAHVTALALGGALGGSIFGPWGAVGGAILTEMAWQWASNTSNIP